MSTSEVFLPFSSPPGQAQVATFVRSTLLVSALQTLRSHRLFDAYFTKLTPKAQTEMSSLIAGTWAPMTLALQHYQAMDALRLDSGTIEAIGREVSDRVNKSTLATLIRATRQFGTTPWTLLSQSHRLRELTWHGSDVSIQKFGPKEARFDWVAQPLATTPYFVTSFGGYLQAALGLFCSRVYTKYQHDAVSRTNRIVYRMSWV